jgi:nitric oxide reductase NorD protein
MAEAEDVLLSAAEWVLGRAQRLLPDRRSANRSEHDAASATLRLERWLVACFGRSWPIVPCGRAARPGWLRSVMDRQAPWQTDPVSVAATDGACLLIPREALGSESSHLAVLALGRRLALGVQRGRREGPLCRDVRWLLEAARGDEWLAALLPGLAPALERERAAALNARPASDRLRRSECAVEELVRTLLSDPGCAVRQDVAEWVGRDDFDYRGVAPVAHWGVLRAPQPGDPARDDRDHRAADAPVRARMRRLDGPVRRKPAREEPGRPGPFIVPPSDPHLSVADPRGLDRPHDRGEEDLDALAEEISRLDELPTIRSDRSVREVLQRAGRSGDAVGDLDATTSSVGVTTYPEWDFRSSAYRDPGVTLREAAVPGSDPDWAARVMARRRPLVNALRRQFAALRPRLDRIPRQIEGDEIDVDGWVDECGDRRAGRSPRGDLYRRVRRQRRDLAVALLVDTSGSTDSWVSREARVIDVAKEAALCFSEALTAVGDRHGIYAFSGRGPDDVRVWIAKRFAEPLGSGVRARLGALAPDRSTRLGGALRHVTAALIRAPAQARILLVLSDGKPNDEDLYEGDYGVEDVRQAVHEAVAARVRTFCVTIDRRGSTYLPRLFGPAGYTLLWDASQLPARLPQVYRRLTHGLSA